MKLTLGSFIRTILDVARAISAYRVGDRYARFPYFRFGKRVSFKRGLRVRLSLGGTLRVGYQELPGGFRSEGFPTQIILSDDTSFDTGGNVSIGSGSIVWLAPGASFSLGNRSYLNLSCKIWVTQKISIGNECAIAWDVSMADSDFHPIIPLDHSGPVPTQAQSSPIQIGNHVWIGSSVTILKGVKIGDGAVIAAGSVVTGEIPANSVAAGNPAKVIREGIRWIL